jgi:hypothetical protein
MNKEAYIHTVTSSGLKAIPLHSFPESSWQSLNKMLGHDAEDIYQYYKEIPHLRRAVDIIADSVAGVPFNYQDFEETTLTVNWSHLLNQVAGDIQLYGRSYVTLEDRNMNGTQQELRRLHPESIEPKYSKMDGLIGFVRKLGFDELHYDKSELAHIYLPVRDKEIGHGEAPAITALKSARLIDSSQDFTQSYLDSGGVNPSLVQIENFNQTPQAEQERVISWFERFFRGMTSDRKNKPLVTGQNIDVKSLGDSSKTLNGLLPIEDHMKKDILVSLGVPETLVNASASNYATAVSDRRTFYTSTITPLLRLIEDSLNPFFVINGLPMLSFFEKQLDIFEDDMSQRAIGLTNMISAGIPLLVSLDLLGFDIDDAHKEMIEAYQAELQAQQAQEPVQVIEQPTRSMLDDLSKYETKAKNKLKQGKALDFDFDSDLIPESLLGAIKGHLETCTSADDIKRVFSGAIALDNSHNHSKQWEY